MPASRLPRRRWPPFLLAAMVAVSLAFAVAGVWWLAQPPGSIAARPDERQALAGRLQDLFATLAEEIRPAVVSVGSSEVVASAEKDNDVFALLFRSELRALRAQALGSGVIIDPRGYILTNAHVVDGSVALEVTLGDGRRSEATLVMLEKETDIALLRIDLPDLTALPLGDSDRLRVGHWVLAVGSPFGLSQTVSAGIVSAVGRSDVGILDYESFIQTDASINQGNSGGPLVDLNGEVVGISTAIYANGAGGSLGIGFAVPINLARALADRWIEGKATCFLGIVSAEVDPVMARYFGLPSPGGVFVQSVHEGSPAESGGIRAKDIILSLDRAAVRSVDHLKVLVARNDGLGAVPVEVLRDHQRQVLEVSLTPKADTPRPSRAPADRHERKRGGSGSLGITVCPLDAKVAEQFGLPAESRGIVVLGVAPGSQAARKRLQPGDLIVEVDGRTVRDMEEFRSAMTGSRSDVMMRVLRAGEALGYVFFQR